MRRRGEEETCLSSEMSGAVSGRRQLCAKPFGHWRMKRGTRLDEAPLVWKQCHLRLLCGFGQRRDEPEAADETRQVGTK